jgi:hypothetical protein
MLPNTKIARSIAWAGKMNVTKIMGKTLFRIKTAHILFL